MENIKNVINWFSIATTDFDRAVKFYEEILAIKMPQDTMPDGTKMAFFNSPEAKGVNGDINNSANQKPGPGGPLIFLDAEGQLDQVLGRVEAAGGSVVMPNTNIGEWGFIGSIKDTEGNVIGLHSKS